MDMRWLIRDSVPVLQKSVFLRNEIDEENNITAIYEWQDVPVVEA